MSRKGNLIIVSGPSGSGKDTIVGKLFEGSLRKELHLSVSATTREPRPGEVDGVNYYFMTKEDFLSKADADGFLEWATFCDNCYGTPLDKVNEQLDMGKDVILVIEVQGAMKVKKLCPDAMLVFVLCPSFAELRKRLVSRNTETVEAIEKRIATARLEIEYAKNYEYLIINDDADIAASELETLILAQRLKVKNNIKIIEEVRKS